MPDLPPEAELPAEFERVDLKSDLKSKVTERGYDYRAINPKDYVPILVLDDGATVTEIDAILGYLTARQPNLGPGGPLGSVRWALAEEGLVEEAPVIRIVAEGAQSQVAPRHRGGAEKLYQVRLSGSPCLPHEIDANGARDGFGETPLPFGRS